MKEPTSSLVLTTGSESSSRAASSPRSTWEEDREVATALERAGTVRYRFVRREGDPYHFFLIPDVVSLLIIWTLIVNGRYPLAVAVSS